MAAHSYARGHPITHDGIHGWTYDDTGELVDYNDRPCLCCGKSPTSEGYDACLGHVPGATSACCGHSLEDPHATKRGVNKMSVIQTRARLTDVELDNLAALCVEALSVAGDFAELGVFRGGSAEIIAQRAMPAGRRLHLFDTFTGNPPELVQDWEHQNWAGSHAAPAADVVAHLESEGLIGCTTIHVGLFEETRYEVAGMKFALVHCDVDLYESTGQFLTWFWPMMSSGGIVVVHDYQHHYTTGVTRAVDEFCALAGVVAEQISTPGDVGQAVIRRP